VSETFTVTGHGGISLTLDAYGDAADWPILLAHGGGQTRHAWRNSGKALAAAGYYALCLDLRGHGDSEWSDSGDYRLEAFAHDLLEVCETLDRPPVLIGASLGGIAAMIAAGELQPEPFAAVIFVDVTPTMEMSGVEKITGFMSAHLEDGFATLEEAADVISEYLPHRKRPANLSGLAKNLRQGEDGRYRWHWDPRFMSGDSRPSASRDPDRLSSAVRNITAPILLVRGRMSELVSEESVRQFLELVPNASYVDVANAGHMVAGDDNDVFTSAIAEFLRTTEIG
jgi:pimeloyl-ACP methyl ester carboxylesterase